MKLLITSICALAISLSACNAKKDAAAEAKANQVAMEKQKQEMLDKGYSLGTIVKGADAKDCAFKIQMGDEGSKYFLDPTNLDASFQQDGIEIWFTYTGLRMMNRCPSASPIRVEDMQRRN